MASNGKETTTLSNGEIAVLVLSKDYDIPEGYENNPRVLALKAADLTHDSDQISKSIPTNTKIVLMTDGIPANTYQSLNAVFRRRNLPFVVRKNATALEVELAKIVPAKAETLTSPKSSLPLGSVRAFIEKEADLRKGSAEEARRLLALATSRGIPTTFGSLAQTISKIKREKGYGEIPNSVKSPQLQALKILDDALASLALIRDYVTSVENENNDLKEFKKKAQALFKD